MYEEKEIKYKKRKKEKITPKRKFINPKQEKVQKIKKETKRNKTNKRNITIKINWKQLIKELIVLIVAIVLIIFTISRINKHNENKNSDFNNNIETIKEALLSYYKTNNLPLNIGDSSSFILEELHKLELVDNIKENDKYCDYLDSYTIITKTTNNEYRLKIYLKCPNTKKAVEEIIECNNNNCSIKK